MLLSEWVLERCIPPPPAASRVVPLGTTRIKGAKRGKGGKAAAASKQQQQQGRTPEEEERLTLTEPRVVGYGDTHVDKVRGLWAVGCGWGGVGSP